MPINTNSAIQLSRLLQMASPGLPIGGYSYSQGMEWAIECGDIVDQTTTAAWIESVMQVYYGQFELPILKRLYLAWQKTDEQQVRYWDERYKAGRDSAESQLESRQMGYSLQRLQNDLATWTAIEQQVLEGIDNPSFPCVFSATMSSLEISMQQTLHVYLWSWLENQVNVAMKALPLGQVAAQKIIRDLSGLIVDVVSQAEQCPDQDISNFCPALSIASCRHETQYSRLFRS